jgi:5-methylcytosine-specific restriction protein B
VLDDSISKQIKDLYKKHEADGQVLTSAKLTECYDTFRRKFGPETLASLDGETLLSAMHEHGQKNSLVYWLEFKDDEELPARFGSISGGSALKFGIYRRKETGLWMTGSPQNQQELTVDEAIQVARRHRDELIAGCAFLERLPGNALDEDYAALQRDLNKASPNVGDSAWGHKYFSMMYPDKLDDFHNPHFGRFHLIKLFEVPPEGDGRYVAAGRFVRIARELGLRVNQLTSVLNHRDGFQPHAYWRIGTSDGTQPPNRWDLMRSGNCVAIGWSELGDLSAFTPDLKSRESIKALMAEKYPNDPRTTGRSGSEVFRFVATVSEGDLAFACDGAAVLGIGKVSGGYSYLQDADFPHQRPVQWLSLEEWKMPKPEGLRKTVYEIKDSNNLIEAERRLLSKGDKSIHIEPQVRVAPLVTKLQGFVGRVQSALERKGQVILYGPPGTGKTYWAVKSACELAASHYFSKPLQDLNGEEMAFLRGDDKGRGVVRICTFHPAYGYEDFIEGYRPTIQSGVVAFTMQAGIFKELCEDAENQHGKKFFLVIDEINRGDIPRIFGELLTILEKDKRGQTVTLPLSRKTFCIPETVYVLGTMNTADRSIALLDVALRRRFGFIELMPNSAVLGDTVVGGIPIGLWLDSLNQRITENVGRDARNLQVGHSYFLEGGHPVATLRQLSRIVQEDVIPLLEEYCYEDYVKIEKILGKGLVDSEKQRIRHDLFEPNREDELVQALLEPCPDLTTTAPVVASTEIPSIADDDEVEGSENSTNI